MNSTFKPGAGTFNAATMLFLLAGVAVPAVAAPAASVTILRSAPNPAAEGVPVTFSAGVNIGADVPTGTITLTDTFKGVPSVLGTFTLDPISAGGTLTISTLAAGPHNVVASYSGDTAYAPSDSQAVQQTILYSFTPTLTTIASSLNPSPVGQSVTFTAAVVVRTPSTIRPTGTVTFYDGTAVLGTASVVNGGGTKTLNSASLSTSSLTAGSHNIQAVYGGDGVFAGSTSPIVGQVVQTAAGPTTTTLKASTPSATVGQAIVFTAQVTAVSGTPSGVVTFTDGQAVLGQAALDVSGQASLTTSYVSAGTPAISAAYGGDATFAVSASTPLTLNVQSTQFVSTTTTIAASVNPSTAGGLIALTATVASASGASMGGAPTGTVTLMDGTTALSTVNLKNGVATFSSVSLTVGTHLLSATYSGDSNYASSAGTLADVVNPLQGAATTTDLSSSSNPSSSGQTITFTATVSGIGGIPSGAVTFIAGTTIASVNLDVSGIAVFTTSVLPVGTTSVSAVYSGDATLLGSASPLVAQSVLNPAALTITASSSFMTYGGVVPTITPSFIGFADGNTIAGLIAELTCSTTATSSSPVGDYPSSCSGAVNGSYTINYVSGIVTITAFARPPVAVHSAVSQAVGSHSVARKTP